MQIEILPKVSVCVVTYNHGKMLEECLDSIIKQKTSFSFEVIIGDDASTDNQNKFIIERYAKEYPELITPVIREVNIGASNNYFDLVKRTKGKYIAHIDGDDIMLPGKLEKRAALLDKHPEAFVTAHDVIEINNAVAAPKSNSDTGIEFFEAKTLLSRGCFFVHSSKMYRRDQIKTWESKEPVVDYYLHLEHSIGGIIAYIKEPLGGYRNHPGGISKQPKFKKIINDAYERAFFYAVELGFDSALVNYGYIRYRQAEALSALKKGDIEFFSEYSKIERHRKHGASIRQILISWLGNMPPIAKLLQIILKIKK